MCGEAVITYVEFAPTPVLTCGARRGRDDPGYPADGSGFLATAVAFGPARMGFGLFLPNFREEFALTHVSA